MAGEKRPPKSESGGGVFSGRRQGVGERKYEVVTHASVVLLWTSLIFPVIYGRHIETYLYVERNLLNTVFVCV